MHVQQPPLAAAPLAPIVSLVATVAISAASHYLVELPILRGTWRWRTIIACVVGVSLLVAAAASWTLAAVPPPDSGDGGVTVVPTEAREAVGPVDGLGPAQLSTETSTTAVMPPPSTRMPRGMPMAAQTSGGTLRRRRCPPRATPPNARSAGP